MNRIRFLVVMTAFLAALSAFAQQNSSASGNADKDQPAQHSTVSNAEAHLQMLTRSLDLTADQQAKLRPILQKMLDQREKLMQDESLSSDQRHQKMQALHEKADSEARKFLNDDQKKKLDDLEAQHHPESQNAQH